MPPCVWRFSLTLRQPFTARLWRRYAIPRGGITGSSGTGLTRKANIRSCGGRARTGDDRLNRPGLYHLSYPTRPKRFDIDNTTIGPTFLPQRVDEIQGLMQRRSKTGGMPMAASVEPLRDGGYVRAVISTS